MLPPQVLVAPPPGGRQLLGCVVEVRVASAGRWSVKGELLRVLYDPAEHAVATVPAAGLQRPSALAAPALAAEATEAGTCGGRWVACAWACSYIGVWL